jgi:tetratricopeptide (TPR) repeat protein
VHFETICQDYRKEPVEVAFVVPQTPEYLRGQLPRFNEEYKVSYKALDDRYNAVVSLYKLNPDGTAVKNLVIDREGIVRLVGEFTPWTEMAASIEVALGRPKDLDLSTLEKAVQALQAPEAYRRWKAAQALGEMKGAAAVEPLTKALSDESGSVRELAAEALGKIGDAKALGPLLAVLEDKSSLVRLAAMKALGQIKDIRAVPPLVKLLPNADVGANAADALAEINRPEEVENALQTSRAIFKGSERRLAFAALGQAYMQRKAHDPAIAMYQKAAEITPAVEKYESRLYAQRLAECYIQKGDMDQAVEQDLSVIRDASPSAGFHFHNLDTGPEKFSERECVTSSFVQKYERQGKLNEIASALEGKLSSSPKDVVLCETLGATYTTQQLYDKACEVYEKALALEPDSLVRRSHLASAYARAAMTERAIEAAKTMAKKVPSDANSYCLMAKVYLDCKLYDEAVGYYEKAISMEPAGSMKESYDLALARCYAAAGKHDKAVAEYAKVARTASDSWHRSLALRGAAECYVYAKRRGDTDAAKAYEGVIMVDSKDTQARSEFAAALYSLGSKYLAEAKLEEAVDVLKHALAIDPNNADAWNNLGCAYIGQGKLDEAAEACKKAVAIDPNHANAWNSLGSAYFKQGKLEEGVEACEKALAIDPNHANACNGVAWFYVTRNIKPREALSLAKKAVELAPGNATIADTLGWAYLQNGQFSNALQTFRTVFISGPDPATSFSSWKGVSAIARSAVEPEVFVRFCDEMIELSKSMADKAASEHTLLWVQSVLAQFHEHRGEKEKAEQQWRKTGFVKTSSWLLIGPFDNVAGSGFSNAYPPEQSIDLHATYQARGTKIGWVELKQDSHGAFVDLGEVFDDNQWAVAYAFARVHSAQETQAQLRVGSDDDVKVWLNGKEVLSRNVGRTAVIDQDIVPVNLKEGTNEILLKVCNRTVGWGFHLRITDSQGRPLEGLKYIPAAELRSTVPE